MAKASILVPERRGELDVGGRSQINSFSSNATTEIIPGGIPKIKGPAQGCVGTSILAVDRDFGGSLKPGEVSGWFGVDPNNEGLVGYEAVKKYAGDYNRIWSPF